MHVPRLISRSLPRATRSLPSYQVQPHLTQFMSIRAPATSWKAVSIRSAAAFSTTSRVQESEGQVEAELSAKLESELSMEKEMRDPNAPPDHLKEYLDNTPFKLQDTPGSEEVILSRTFGDEKIRVSFNIDDLNNTEEDADQMQDQAIEDEYGDPTEAPPNMQSGGGNTKGAVNHGRTSGGNIQVAPEDSVAPADNQGTEGETAEGQEPGFAAHISITIERPQRGALQLDAIAQDGVMVIENVSYFRDVKHIEPKTREQEEAAARLYTGPPFGNLDEDLQVLFEKYLDERGINTTMALFIPEYIDFKEQKEYLSWLTSLKRFVD